MRQRNQSCPWVGSTHGLGRVEILKDFSGLCWGSENVLTLSSLCPNVCLLYTYGVRLGCGLGWVVGPKISFFDGWFGLGQWFGGFGWVEEGGPTDNSARNIGSNGAHLCHATIVIS